MNEEEILTAYCGLYCGDCIRYNSRASFLASELRRELEKSQFAHYADVKSKSHKEFRNFKDFTQTLNSIASLQCYTPCRIGGDGCGGKCEVKKCVNEKALDGCWECADSKGCKKLDFLIPYHGNGPKNNLSIIKEHGLKNWAKHRDKCYPWLQEGRNNQIQ